MGLTSKNRSRANAQKERILFRRRDFPVKVGWYQGKSSKLPRSFYHSELEFQLICQGEGYYFIRNQNHLFRKNSVLIIHNNEVHNYIPHPDKIVKRINLIFSPRILKERVAGTDILHHLHLHHHLFLKEKEAIMAELLLQEIAEESIHQKLCWREAVLNNVEKFLILLERSRNGGPPAIPKQDPIMRDVINYLEHNFTERILLTDVATRFHLSSTSLSRVFKKYVGLGFKDYLIHRRIVETKRLLNETELKISSIASKVGFEDLSNFNRNFRLLVGLSPSGYRKISS